MSDTHDNSTPPPLIAVSRLASGLAALRYLIDQDANMAADLAAILEDYACNVLEEDAKS